MLQGRAKAAINDLSQKQINNALDLALKITAFMRVFYVSNLLLSLVLTVFAVYIGIIYAIDMGKRGAQEVHTTVSMRIWKTFYGKGAIYMLILKLMKYFLFCKLSFGLHDKVKAIRADQPSAEKDGPTLLKTGGMSTDRKMLMLFGVIFVMFMTAFLVMMGIFQNEIALVPEEKASTATQVAALTMQLTGQEVKPEVVKRVVDEWRQQDAERARVIGGISPFPFSFRFKLPFS